MADLDIICKELNKKYKSDYIHSGYSDFAFERIPFSSPKMNFMTYGGVPRGYIVEFSGGENGGKTTTADLVIGLFAPLNGTILIDDCNMLDYLGHGEEK